MMTTKPKRPASGGVASLILAIILAFHNSGKTIAMPSHNEMMFAPLSCNQNIMTQNCIPWSTYFGTEVVFTDKVIIPCGECVILDPLSSEYTSTSSLELTMNDGLSIVGRLLIPSIGDPQATKLKLTTKSVEVEGILSIYEGINGPSADRKVASDGVPNFEIHLFGAQDGERTLIPHAENSHACSSSTGGGCNIGKLPIAIAGGRLDVRAMPKVIDESSGDEVDCPTWTDLIEIVTGGPPNPEIYPQVPPSPPGCDGEDQIVSSFNNDASTNWLGYWNVYGSSIPTVNMDPVDNSLQVVGRTKSTQGPRVKIYDPSTTNNDPCKALQANVSYLLHTKIKVSALDGYSPSSCETTGKCLYLQLQKIGRYNKSILRTIPLSKHYPKTPDGEYFDFRAVLDVTQAELDDVTTYNGAFYLLFMGIPAPGYNVNVLHMELTLASNPDLFPDTTNVCGNLISNGNFEGGQYYPWLPRSGGSFLIEEEEDGNMYLRHAGRTPVYPGLEQTLVTGCLEADLLYQFSMKVRVNSDSGGAIVIKWVLTNPSGSVVHRELFRTPKQYASDGWISHNHSFTVTQEVADAIGVKLITMVSEGSPGAIVDYDDIKIEFQQGVGQELLVDSPFVAKCWGSEGELLVTPSTNKYTDSTVVNVVGVSSKVHNGKVVGVIQFDGEAGFHPTYANPDSRTRAEVALLSRNAIVTNTPDPENSLHGGHLIVLHTPGVAQHLEGVQFRGSGQQGNLGRYPIHFHISHNVSGSVVKANSIVESNQRCIVVHGSNNALIEANVAYNTHCFMTEDGNEFGNLFQNNIGALTLPVETVNLLSSVDSDHNPSTFWMPTPRNSLIGNVAAGSKGPGFWFEVEGFFRGASRNAPEVLDGTLPIPSRQDLYPYVFESNTAHSNEGDGMQTYPSGGWKPPHEAIFKDFVAYRNRGAGAFSHNGLNQTFIGGFYADNQAGGIDIDRSYQGRIDDVTMVGYTSEYESLVMSPSNQNGIQALSPCGYNSRVQRGIQLHAGKSGGGYVGYHVSNITFERYGSVTGCYDSAAIDVDSRENRGYFDPRTSIKNILYIDVDEASQINLCDSHSGGIEYIHIGTDNGGMIVSNNELWTTFPSTGCTPLAGGAACAQVCPNTCVRSLKVSVPAAATPATTLLHVFDTSTGKQVQVPGEWGSHMNSHAEFYMLTAHYRLYLPVGGTYLASFSDSGVPIWPTFVDTIYEDTGPDGCDGEALNYVYDGSSAPQECGQLLQYGYGAWLHSGGGVYNVTDGNGWYIENKDRDSWANGLVQNVDTRCFDAGVTYHFAAKVMLSDENGSSVDCNPSDRECPVIRMNSSGGPPGTTTVYNEFFSFASWVFGEWNEIDALIVISDEEATKSRSMIHIYGAKEAWSLRIKDVSMSRLD